MGWVFGMGGNCFSLNNVDFAQRSDAFSVSRRALAFLRLSYKSFAGSAKWKTAMLRLKDSTASDGRRLLLSTVRGMKSVALEVKKTAQETINVRALVLHLMEKLSCFEGKL